VAQLKSLTVRGFKSIKELPDFKLRTLNVLIGANGAGKSNFISLFRMLAEMVEQRLQLFVQDQDGPDALLFGTRKRTPQMDAEFYFDQNGYRISLRASGERLVFAREETWFTGSYATRSHSLGSGHDEARLPEATHDTFAAYVRPAIASWRVYHFHDTSNSAPVRHAQPVRDNLRLKPDASNLAPFVRLLRERHKSYYDRIVETIRLVTPFFGDFVYREEPGERVDLEWFDVNDPDTPFGPRQLSDGTLRFICLAVLLLQPRALQSDTILLDEPELGLHPYALNVLAELLKQAAQGKQVIVSTQSVELINSLDVEDIVVVNRREGASTFDRLNPETLSEWLSEYSLGELWKRSIIGGRPARG
jgi:predicted ATPase